MNRIKLIIADDRKEFIGPLVSLLEEYPGIEITGTANNGIELLELLQKKEADVLLLDIRMPKMNGYEAMSRIMELYPQLRTIILSIHYDSYHAAEFFKLGASAFLPKNTEVEKLVEAIQAVVTDGEYIDKATIRLLKQSVEVEMVRNSIIKQRVLDDKEVELLRLMCEGKKGKEIMEILSIPRNGLSLQKRTLRAKTLCRSDVELVWYAIQHGYVPVKEL